MRRILSKHWKWAWTVLCILIVFALGYFGPRPNRDRVETALVALEQAGYHGASANRYQSPGNMHRCGVGQIKNRGYAYAWETATQSGVFCYPTDGRPQRILLDE
ncbi:hypothetical protein D3C87_320340 [compost metagenome]